MIPLEILTAAVGSFQAIAGMLSALSKSKLSPEAKSLVADLQSEVISAQASAINAQTDQFTLLERVRNLESELKRHEAWEVDKARYELKTVGDQGILVYALKESEGASQPPHNICANCYNQQHISILQPEMRTPGMVQFLLCHSCNAEIITSGFRREDQGMRTKKTTPPTRRCPSRAQHVCPRGMGQWC